MSKYIALALIFSICISGINSATQFALYNSKYPICDVSFAKDKTKILANEDAQSNSALIPDFTDVSRFTNYEKSDVYQLRYKILSASPYTITFTCTDSQLAQVSTVSATPTVTIAPVVVGFKRNYLVTKQTNGATVSFKAYVFKITGGTGAITTITLSMPSGFTSISAITPISVDQSTTGTQNLVAFVQGIGAGPYSNFYTYTDSTTPVESRAAKWLALTPKPDAASDFVGNQNLFYDKTNARVILYTSGDFKPILLTTFSLLATDTVSYFSLNFKTSALLFLNSAGAKTGKILLSQNDEDIPVAIDLPAATSVLYKTHTDGIQNVIVVSNVKVAWIRAVSSTDVWQTEKVLTAEDTDLFSTTFISLAGDKGFALYGDKVVIYQNTAEGTILLYLSLTIANNIVTASAPIDLHIKTDCICVSLKLKTLTCFSTSLSCVMTANNNEATCTQTL